RRPPVPTGTRPGDGRRTSRPDGPEFTAVPVRRSRRGGPRRPCDGLTIVVHPLGLSPRRLAPGGGGSGPTQDARSGGSAGAPDDVRPSIRRQAPRVLPPVA